MKLIFILIVNLLVINSLSYAQIKNIKTNTVKIYGNCEICKTTIEKAGNKKKESKVTWNKESQTATIEFNDAKTSLNDILKRVALAGYDSDMYLAPDATYNSLASCCQYERPRHPSSNRVDNSKSLSKINADIETNDIELAPVLDSYFMLKDAFVHSNLDNISAEANKLSIAIQQIDMNKLTEKEHSVWMKIKNDLLSNAQKIATEKQITKQRAIFSLLSEHIYAIVKVSKLDRTIYYTHCPMFNNGKGANWLSLQEQINNPYFGSQMLTCGHIIDTISQQ